MTNLHEIKDETISGVTNHEITIKPTYDRNANALSKVIDIHNIDYITNQLSPNRVGTYNNLNLELDATSPTFLTKWDTTLTSAGSSNDKQISLPLVSSGTYDFIVDWGDGVSDHITQWDQIQVTHTYSSSGVYMINATGLISGWRFANSGDRLKIVDLVQWGNMSLGNFDRYFHGAENMVLSATDAPDLNGTTSMFQAFRDCINLGEVGNMNNWNVSTVIDMQQMFRNASTFNQPIRNWDVSNVISMRSMFQHASDFNQPIDAWDVSNVNDMSHMFQLAKTFNQDISGWNVSKVTNMSWMFSQVSTFNQPIGSWNVSSVTNMQAMFHFATSFNQPIENWIVSNVLDMSRLFEGAASFNQPIKNWQVTQLNSVVNMFAGASSFNQPLGSWNLPNVKDLSGMFLGTSLFNQDITTWDVSHVINMARMFRDATSFNQPIGVWDVSNVSETSYMFYNATSFNQPLHDWNTSKVVDMSSMFSFTSFNQDITNWKTGKVTDMSGMFRSATSFNQPVGTWDVSNVVDMAFMFYFADSFDQNLGTWDVSNVKDMSYMFTNKLTPSNYGAILIGWSQLPTLQTGVLFDAGSSKYPTASRNARLYIIDTYSWTIVDWGELDIISPEIDSPADVVYELGSTGNTVRWTIGDIHPLVYNVTIDSSPHISDVSWVNGTVDVNVDGLSEGDHFVSIFVYDHDLNEASDTVMVTVKAPTTNNSNPNGNSVPSIDAFLFQPPILLKLILITFLSYLTKHKRK